jgi:hypothetical protein
LQKLVRLNLPGIGKFISDIVEIVEGLNKWKIRYRDGDNGNIPKLSLRFNIKYSVAKTYSGSSSGVFALLHI